MTTATIPEEVMEGIMAVRATGVTNMLDRKGVMEAAEFMGYDETADWLRHRGNRQAYQDWFFGR